jgi:hypothetical protein
VKTEIASDRSWHVVVSREDGDDWPDLISNDWAVKAGKRPRFMRPDSLRFTVRIVGGTDTIAASTPSAHGHTVKADGSLGIQASVVTFWTWQELPAWAPDIITAALAQIAEDDWQAQPQRLTVA